jgi:hypothetical protein
MDMNVNDLANSGKAMLDFIESNLTFPNAVLSAENRNEYVNLLAGFRYSRVNVNATDAYNVDEADDDGYLRYSSDDLREALQNVNNDEDNLIHTLIEQMKQQVKDYIEFLENGEFDVDMENNAWLSVTLQNIAAVFNLANAAAGGKKATKPKKATKSKAKKVSKAKSAKKSKKVSKSKLAKKTKSKTRKH